MIYLTTGTYPHEIAQKKGKNPPEIKALLLYLRTGREPLEIALESFHTVGAGIIPVVRVG